MSTGFAPETARRTKTGVFAAAAFLSLCFLIVIVVRYLHAHAVAQAGENAYSRPPSVDVVIAQPATAGQDLILPGETAAWYATTLYARVNGYVAKWLADIGDHVKKGQLLAIIETPELDAELQPRARSCRRPRLRLKRARPKRNLARPRTNAGARFAQRGGVRAGAAGEESGLRNRRGHVCGCAANAQVSLDKSKVDQYGALTEFKQVKAPSTEPSPSARSTSATWWLPAAARPHRPQRTAQTDPLRIFVDVPQSAAGELMSTGVPAEIRATGAVGGAFRCTA